MNKMSVGSKGFDEKDTACYTKEILGKGKTR